ncbi:MAG: endonuclease/exonuclease/phosphatase family protein [Candidatus Hodarchaeota archaeon]
MGNQLRVMTFNIKNSRDILNIKHRWKLRKKEVLSLLQKYSPDVIALQEVLIEQLEYLAPNLPNYEYVGVGRDDGIHKGEFNPIFYRTSLDPDDYGTFWLSDTPEICSNTWGGLNRICTWINFKEESFAFFNTHFEHRKAKIRLKSIPLLISQIEQQTQDMPVIVSGDFNFGRNSKEYSLMSQYFQDIYSYDQENRFKWAVTSHGFKGKTKSRSIRNGRKLIDYIWLKGDFKVLHTQIIHDNPRASDHWPVLADLVLSK